MLPLLKGEIYPSVPHSESGRNHYRSRVRDTANPAKDTSNEVERGWSHGVRHELDRTRTMAHNDSMCLESQGQRMK
jgi:hypothetical protein